MGIGLSEMILLAAIALVVMGPEKFPGFAKVVVRTWRDLKTYADDVKGDLAKELKPVQKEMKQLSRYDVNTYLNTPAEVKKPEPVPAAGTASAPDPGVGEKAAPISVPEDYPVSEPSPGGEETAPEVSVEETPRSKGDYTD